MKERFLVIDYREEDPEEKEMAKIKIVDQDELWKIIHSAVKKLPQVAVYEIGRCLFDWS